MKLYNILQILLSLILMTSCAHKKQIASIDREGVRKAVTDNLPAFKKCFRKELKLNPDIRGKLVVEWSINELGQPSRVGIKSTELKNEIVEKCIVDIFETIKFPSARSEERRVGKEC